MKETALQVEQDEHLDGLNYKEYKDFIAELKCSYQSAQLRAAVKVNTEVIQFYWEIGRRIVNKQQTSKWGDKVLQRISIDMQEDSPSIKGFSVRNLKFMRQFYAVYPGEIGKQPVSQLPWGILFF